MGLAEARHEVQSAGPGVEKGLANGRADDSNEDGNEDGNEDSYPHGYDALLARITTCDC